MLSPFGFEIARYRNRISLINFADLSKALVCMEPGFMKIDELQERTTERIQAVIKVAQG
jgi:hypothetical protein